MSNEIPDTLIKFTSFLTRNSFVFEKQFSSPGFGDLLIIYRSQHLNIRLLRDRCDWFIQISSAMRSDAWYDIDLIIENATGQTNRNIPTIEEQVKYLQDNWNNITTMFNTENENITHASLAYCRKERTKRLFQSREDE